MNINTFQLIINRFSMNTQFLDTVKIIISKANEFPQGALMLE